MKEGEKKQNAVRRRMLQPTEVINGYKVRPGIYQSNGAMVINEGVCFTIHSIGATSCTLLLYHREGKKPFARIPFPESFRLGNTFSMIVYDLDITEFEYAYSFDGPYDESKGLLFKKENVILDPYAKAVTDQSVWGKRKEKEFFYKARVVDSDFDWGDFKQPGHAFKDMIIYEMHVRGFTRHPSSHTKHPGTYEAIMEKIPYLVELGVNAVELMPIFEFDENDGHRVVDGETLYNYWGYNTVSFFAPNTSYTAATEYNHEGDELKRVIKALNENGIEVILDVVFNHTAEGNELGPCFSFKGIDNNIYYMLTPDGYYYNFSGCGNVVNCNHPIVQQFILDCLRYWVIEYRVDGFRFDLASILGRNEDGSPMSKPPVLQNLAFDPILGRVKLIAEAWDAGGLYQVGSFPSWNRWAEWNGRYRDDMRSFLKGDSGYAWQAIQRMAGSEDIYAPGGRKNASVNFINCHDGFTLYDLYAYNEKHNEKNGWNNTDGENNNRSWNCGAEGETKQKEVLELRTRLRKNAFAVLMLSRGCAMFLSGDEFCNTQFGNNNAYCQDNEISWLDWNRTEQYHEMFKFCKYMIAFRKAHPVVKASGKPAACGFPDFSIHNERPWNDYCDQETRVIGLMFAGRTEDDTRDDVVYIGLNAHWEAHTVVLPELLQGYHWKIMMNTALPHTSESAYQKGTPVSGNNEVCIGARSLIVAVME
ncbi:MAG: glycogen debranching protein [Lachnospiraceae bacterium]